MRILILSAAAKCYAVSPTSCCDIPTMRILPRNYDADRRHSERHWLVSAGMARDLAIEVQGNDSKMRGHIRAGSIKTVAAYAKRLSAWTARWAKVIRTEGPRHL